MTLSAMPSFIDVLHAQGAAADRAEKLALYGWLVGSWDMDVTTYDAEGRSYTGQGEIHAGWVLEGRAIQDVWMIPRRADRREGAPVLPVAGNWYGTTLRIYDPSIDAWHIFWSDPATGIYVSQIGKASGQDIVQEGRHASGIALRWRFTAITPESFHWIGERSADEGVTWRLQVDILARRTGRA